MRTRPLGAGGPPVTALGLGLAALGRPGYMTLGHAADIGADASVEALQARCFELLDLAWAAGVRYFDVARSYGRGEAFLGAWLRARGIPPGAVTVGSKWGYVYEADWQRQAPVHEVKIHTVENFWRQWAETQATLGEHLSVYLIHSATLESGVLEQPAVLEALAAAREATGGRVRMGLSVTGPAQAATLRRAMAVAPGLLEVVQATWSVLEPSAGAALAEAHAAGLGVIVKEPLANGRLTPRSPALQARLGEEGLDVAALSAALAQPFADVVLLGAATPAQLRSNLRALAAGRAAPDFEGWAEPPEVYWAARKKLPWT